MQHIGDLEVTGHHETKGQVTGTTYVRSGGHLIVRGQLSGGLIVDKGGRAVIHGQVSRDVINNGSITLHGQVSGRIHGNQPTNLVTRDQVAGLDLPTPFLGPTVSWSSSS